jgi:hypothetical protein
MYRDDRPRCVGLEETSGVILGDDQNGPRCKAELACQTLEVSPGFADHKLEM